MADNEIRVYYTKEGKWEDFADADADLFAYIRGYVAHKDNVARAGNSLSGTLSKINSGKYKANPIYGYLNRNSEDTDIRLKPCKKYKVYVETIFETYLKLGSLTDTVAVINKLKIPTFEYRRRSIRKLSGKKATLDCQCSHCGKGDKAYKGGDIYRKTFRKPLSERRNFYLCMNCLLWNVTSLKTLIQNPLYMGHTYFGRKLSGKIYRTHMDNLVAKEVGEKEKGKKTFNKDAILIEDAAIPIIREEDWRLAQKLLREINPIEMKKRELKNEKRGPIGKNRFRQVIFCTKCNRGYTGKIENGGWCYKCLTYDKNTTQQLCHAGALRKEEVEDILCGYAVQFLFHPPLPKEDANKMMDVLISYDGQIDNSVKVKYGEVYGAMKANESIKKIVETICGNRDQDKDYSTIDEIEKKIRVEEVSKGKLLRWITDNMDLLSEREREDRTTVLRQKSELISKYKDRIADLKVDAKYTFSPIDEAVLLYLNVHEEEFLFNSRDGCIYHEDDIQFVLPIGGSYGRQLVVDSDTKEKSVVLKKSAVDFKIEDGILRFEKKRNRNLVVFDSKMSRDDRSKLADFVLEKLASRLFVNHRRWVVKERTKSEVTEVFIQPRLSNGRISLQDSNRRVAVSFTTTEKCRGSGSNR